MTGITELGSTYNKNSSDESHFWQTQNSRALLLTKPKLNQLYSISLAAMLIIGLLLASVNRAYAADLGAGFSACEGAGCPPNNVSSFGVLDYSSSGENCGSVTPGGPNRIIGSDAAFSLYVGGNFTVTSAGPAEAEGVVAIGGNYINQKVTGQYNIGVAGLGSCVTAPDGATHLFVGGTTSSTGASDSIIGALGITGDAELADTPTTANFSFCGGCDELPLSDPALSATIAAKITEFQTTAQCLVDFNVATDPLDQFREASYVNSFGNASVDCPGTTKVAGKCPAGTYVANIDGSQLDLGYVSNLDTTTNFTDDGNTTLIINVTGAGTVSVRTQPAGPAFDSSFARSMLWNFVNASQVNFEGSSQFNGTVLIPNGGSEVRASGMNGRFIAGGDVLHDLVGSEFHNFDFIGEIPDACAATVTPPADPVSIGDYVWFDENGDNLQGVNESGIGGVTVNLIDSSGAVVNTTETDQLGRYFFSTDSSGTPLPSATYAVEFVAPPGMDFVTADVGGDDALDSDAQGPATAVSARTIDFNVPSATNDFTRDAGFVLESPGLCAAGTDVGGNVFRDLNADGVDAGASEPAFNGITVNAYDNDNQLIGSTTVLPDGTYNLPGIFPTNTHVRIEFENLPSFMQSSAAGPNSGTTTQFYDAGTCAADLAVSNPADFCESNPQMVTSCFGGGDSGLPAVASQAALKEYDYNSAGRQSADALDFENATVGQFGSVWGVAYHRESETILASAVLRRHTGLYPGADTTNPISTIFSASKSSANSGAVWLDGAAVGIDADVSAATNPNSGVTAVPDNAARDLGAPSDQSDDFDAYPLVAKVGFGDMAMSEDGKTVYVVNLADRKLYAIDYESVTSPTTATFSSIDIPEPVCSNGIARPWGLKVHDGKVYAGSVCTGELETNKTTASQNTLGLTAQVYILTPDADPAVGAVGAFNNVPVLQFPLDYDGVNNNNDKGCPGSPTFGGATAQGCRWSPWIDVWADNAHFAINRDANRPTPILADIEIDADGFMTLGFTDRTGGLQLGWNQPLPDGSNRLARSVLGGDLLLAAPNGDGTWTLESNASAGGRISAVTGGDMTGDSPGGVNTNQGPDNGEFYGEDYFRIFGVTLHAENAQGGLAYLPGSREMTAAIMDPNDFRSSGILWSVIDDGTRSRDYELIAQQDQLLTSSRFGKAGSLGDVELLCSLAPIEIGNRVWKDDDMNGVQDPCENPIAGVEVQLYEWNDSVASGGNGDGIYQAGELGAAVTESGTAVTAVTDASGEYYFGARQGAPNLGFVGESGLSPTTKYVVAIDPTQGALSATPGVSPIAADSAAGADGETNTGTSTATNGNHDSNGLIGLEPNLVIAPLMTGLAGQNDHTFDFGFFGTDLGDAPDSYGTTLANGGPIHPTNPNLLIGAVVDSELDGVPSAGADGDDLAGTDDEDGIDIAAQSPLAVTDAAGVPTTSYTLTGIDVVNTTGEDGFLVGYIDFNRDGDFDDPGERSATATVTASGTASLTFSGISGLAVGDSYLRLRFASEEAGVLTPGGMAVDGEIEDHPIDILPVVRAAKVLVPDTLTETFTLTAGTATNTTAGNGDVTDFVPFNATAITVSEAPNTLPNPFVTTSLCTDGNGATVYTGAAGDLDLTTDQITTLGTSVAQNTITCTFTNTNLTTVAVVKTATPADDTNFTFESSRELIGTGATDTIPASPATFILDGELVDTDADTFNNQIAATGNFTAGAITFTETVPVGWLLRSVSCTDVDGLGVSVTVPGTVNAGGTSGFVTPTIDAGDTITCMFDNVETVSLGSVIWDDSAVGMGNVAADGVQQANEPGITGAVVTLIDNATGATAINPATGVAFPAVNTGPNGEYNFNGMLPGDYRVSVVLPAANANYIPTPVQQPNANNDVNLDSNIENITDPTPATLPFGSESIYESGVITLSVGTEPVDEAVPGGAADSDGPNQTGLVDDNGNMTLDMGFIQTVSLGSTVWFDSDIDGVQEAAEPAIAGATVTVVNADGSPYDSDPFTAGVQAVAPVVTNADGEYNFNNLLPGEYRVQVDVSTATSHTGAELVATPIQLADPDPNPNDGSDNNLDSNIDGAAPGANPASGIYQSGVVRLDVGLEPTGEQDPIDAGGVLIADQPNQGGVADANGNMAVDFGFYIPVSLGSTLWFDANTDGLQTEGELGIAGASVTLLNGAGVPVDNPNTPAVDTYVVITDAQGQYNFNGLAAGDYQVQADLTAATNFDGTVLVQTPMQVPDPDAAGDDNTDSNIDTVDLANDVFTSGTINLSVGGEPTGETDGISATGPDQPNQADVPDANGNMTLDMGFIAPVSLGSTVWEDYDGDGTQDVDEAPIGNATVRLFAADGTTEIPVGPDGILGTGDDAVGGVLTDGSGQYSFSNLAPGSYRVQVDLTTVPSGGDLFATPVQVLDPNDDVNSDSNYDAAAPGSNAGAQLFQSGLVTLTASGEPTGETDPIGSPSPAGASADQPNMDPANPDDSGNMTVDFGFVRPVSLGSTIWLDANADGVQDDNEVGIENAEVVLIDVTGSPIAGVSSVTTNADGEYNFNDIPPGDYRIQVTLPTGTTLAPSPFQQTDPNDDDNTDSNVDRAIDGNPTDLVHFSGIISVTPDVLAEPTGETDAIDANTAGGLVSDQPNQGVGQPDVRGNMTLDMGFFEPVSLGSTIWIDSDADGVQEAGEPAIEGVTVTLLTGAGAVYDNDPNTPGTQALTVTTDFQGQYNFNGLPPSSYRVRADVSTATSVDGDALKQTLVNQPLPDDDVNTDSNIASNPATNVYESGPITLGVGSEPPAETDPIGLGGADQPNQGAADADANGNMTLDLGFYIPVSVGSIVWEDLNGNGFQDAGETAIPGVEVTLLDAAGVPVPSVPTVTTDMNGQYNFDNLVPGDYRIQVNTNVGTVTNGSELFPTPIQVPDPDAVGAPFNNNTDSNIDSAAPGADPVNGIYRSGVITLSPGDEPEDEANPLVGGAADSDQPNQGLTPADDPDNAGNMTVDFGFVRPVSLGSTVWEDANVNGTQDDGESAIEGATISLLDSAGNPVPGVADVVTDINGNYNFNGLAPGDYQVRVDLSTVTDGGSLIPSPVQEPDPEGNINTDSNLEAGFDTDLTDQTYFSGIVQLRRGEEPEDEADALTSGGLDSDQPNQGLTPTNQPDDSGNMTVDFGFYKPVSLGSTVWIDSNTDGEQTAGEPAIVGATVTVLNTDGTVFDSDLGVAGIQALVATTDVDGQYNFNGLPEGSYRVEVDISTATSVNGLALQATPSQTPSPEDNNPIDSNIDAAAPGASPGIGIYRSGVVVLEVGTEPTGETDPIGTPGPDQPNQDLTGGQPDTSGNMTVDFGFFAPVSLGSVLWEDINADGTQENAEPPVVGATVTLLNADGSVFDGNPNTPAVDPVTSVSDAAGLYNFNDLPPGDYRVQVDLSTATNAAELVPTPTQVADPDAAGPGQDNNLDSNIDTAFDTDATDQIHTSGVVTLAPGTEPVDEASALTGGGVDTDQPNQGLTPTDDPDDSGNMTVDFGFIRPVSLGSTLWIDLNRDGTQDDNEPPLVGVPVRLLDAAGVPIAGVAPVTSDAQGQYLFDGLAPGTYRVAVDLSAVPGGAALTPTPVQVTDPEDNSNTDSNFDAVFDTNGDQVYISGDIALAAGTEPTGEQDPIDGVDGNGPVPDVPNPSSPTPDDSGNMTLDMGFFTPVSIGSFIWEDRDGDGVQDANEPPIAGTQVALLVEDPLNPGAFIPAVDITNTAVPVVTVGPDGLYNFTNLPAGNYKVQATPPSNYSASPVQTVADNDDTANDSNIAAETAPGSGVYESGVFTLIPTLEPIEVGDTQRGDAQDGASGSVTDTSGNMTVDFGFAPSASIGNYVWLDLDMDGVQDANEDGIPGVEVTITPPPGVDAGAGIDTPITVTTGPNGEYLFPNLPPYANPDPSIGYVVTVDPATLPPGLVQTYDEGDTGVIGTLDNSSNGIQLDPSEEHLTADFGYTPPIGSLGDTIWVDANDDGIQNPGEPGIPGVIVTLQPAPGVDPDGPGPAGPGEPITAVTDENGKYLFTGLPLNETYIVTVTGGVPPQYSFSTSGLGDPDVRDGESTPDQADESTIVVLTDAQPVNLDSDFGYLPSPDQNNSIGDTIWRDSNRDGVIDASESRIPGVTVTLLNESGDPIATTTTDDQGMYLFTGIPDASSATATYTVVVTDQNNVLDGLVQTYDDDDGTGPFTTPNQSVVTGLGVGVDTPVEDLDQDFGYVDDSNTSGLGVIGDTIFFDADDNGAPGEGEGLEGVTVTLIGPGPDGDITTADDNVLLDTQTTDENGNYLFTGLDVTGTGTGVDYLVMVDTSTLPNGGDGWSNTVDPDTPGRSGDSMSVTRLTPTVTEDLDQDFGYLGEDNNSLSGTVWPDTDGGGLQDEAGSFEGVTIEVRDQNGNVIRRIRTDADGNYSVSNLPDGMYTVVVTDEDNVLNGFAHTDSPNGASDTTDQTSKDDTGYVVDLDSAGVIDTPVSDETGDFGYQPVITNPISLGSFMAENTGSGEVTITWATQTEVVNMGFNLYAQVDGEWQQLNDRLILSQGDSVGIQSYTMIFATEAEVFAISDIDLTGTETMHGPYQIGRQFGFVGDRQVIDWAAEKAERDAKRQRRNDARMKGQKNRMQSLRKAGGR